MALARPGSGGRTASRSSRRRGGPPCTPSTTTSASPPGGAARVWIVVPVRHRPRLGRRGRRPGEQRRLELGVAHRPRAAASRARPRCARRRWSDTVVNGIPNDAATWRRDKPWPTASLRMSRTLRIARRGLGNSHLLGAGTPSDGGRPAQLKRGCCPASLRGVRKPPESVYEIDPERVYENLRNPQATST